MLGLGLGLGLRIGLGLGLRLGLGLGLGLGIRLGASMLRWAAGCASSWPCCLWGEGLRIKG